MKSILKPLASNVAIAALVISAHTSAQSDNQQLCQLDEQQLNTELSHFGLSGKELFNSALSYLDTQCQPHGQKLTSSEQNDTKPPKITSWQLSSNDVDISTDNQTITLTVRAYDESGIDSVSFGLLPPNQSYPFPQNRIKLENWTATSEEHVYEASGSVTLNTAKDIGGIWRAAMMFLKDKNGRYSVYTSAATLKSMGFKPYVIVTNDTLVDTMAPQLRGYSWSNSSVNVNTGQKKVTAEVLLHDETGVKGANIYVAPPAEYSSTAGKSVHLSNWQATQESNVYKASAEFTFDSNDVAGIWRASISTAYDTDSKNYASISNQEIKDLSFTPDIEIINSNAVDTTPPRLIDLSISDHEINITEGSQQVTVLAKFYDPSGISSGYISLVSPTGNYQDDKVISISDWQSSNEQDVFIGKANFTIQNNDHVGAWYARSWFVKDKSSNQFDSTKVSDLIAKRINPYVFLNVSNADIKDLYIDSNITTLKSRIERPVPYQFSIKELAGKVLPEKFSISVTGNEHVEVMLDSISGTSASSCEFLNGSGSCAFSIPAKTLEANVTFNLTPKTAKQDTIEFRFISDEPELKFENNQLNVSVIGHEPVMYTVKFVEWDNTVLATVQVEEGETARAPQIAPTREGYTFIGWDQALSKITVDTTFKAQYELNTYQVIFKDWDGTTLKQEVVGYKQTAQGLDIPPIRVGYTFTGWDHELSSITENLTITAQYDINKYQVTFKDWDGTVLKQVIVNHGQTTADFDNQITREGYTFIGWDHALSNINANLTVTAQYEINKYQVIFKDWDGKELAKLEIEHGAGATAPATPSRVNHTFSGWDKAFDKVTGALTITAQYTKTSGQTTKVENNKAGSSSSGSLSFGMSLLAFLFISRRLNGKALIKR
ncbi:InlB B-repeat-containing protein [Pseudoalteromonas sp. S16_S37]|uniref:InlB B-repeat-containing protein n=1 Tax=Pseudoalteromonas sp. S16_S37 TaxID=2720228 RepID=UPI001680FA42|nr:InlB B-repeat-containing protein [Pseudoalteromonas sp. S16_S37]MBD1583900.1 InlB B-repeat-containing protein [Pseudoalteromonas sp. S16_S37]